MGQPQHKDLDLDQQVAFLKKISFFHGFDDHELKQFLSLSKWLRVNRKTFIIKEGTTERAFYILVKGGVKVQKHLPDGGSNPLELTTLKTGDCFGEMALVTEIKRTADVVASEDSFILRVEPEIVNTSNVFLQLKFYKRFCESLVTRLDFANKRLAGSPEAEPAPSALHEALTVGLPAVPEPLRQEKAVIAPKPRETPAPPARKASQDQLPPMPSKDDRLPANKLYKRLKPESPLPINPLLAKELKNLLGRGPDADNTRRFADLISMDPVLSCAVIQAANSPYFRRATTVATVPHAMVIVGIKHVQEIISSAIKSSKDARVFGGNVEIATSFWKHAVVVARIAELLREIIQVHSSVDIHLAGLLHDLGMLAIDSLSPNFYPHAGSSPEFEDLSKAEKEYVGVDHGQAGAWLGEFLGLPPVYLDVMRFHHSPEKVGNPHALPVALVNLANIFAAERKVCIGKPKLVPDAVARSFSWVLIQEQHRPFLDVNVVQFIEAFNVELDKSWNAITADLP